MLLLPLNHAFGADGTSGIKGLEEALDIWRLENTEHVPMQLLCTGYGPMAELMKEAAENSRKDDGTYDVSVLLSKLQALVETDLDIKPEYRKSEAGEASELEMTLRLWIAFSLSYDNLCESAEDLSRFYYEVRFSPYRRWIAGEEDEEGIASSFYANNIFQHWHDVGFLSDLSSLSDVTLFGEIALGVDDEFGGETTSDHSASLSFALSRDKPHASDSKAYENHGFRPHAYRSQAPFDGVSVVSGVALEGGGHSAIKGFLDLGWRMIENRKSDDGTQGSEDGERSKGAVYSKSVISDWSVGFTSRHSDSGVSGESLSFGAARRWTNSCSNLCRESFRELGALYSYNWLDASGSDHDGNAYDIYVAYEAKTPLSSVSLRAELGYGKYILPNFSASPVTFDDEESGYATVSLIYRQPSDYYSSDKVADALPPLTNIPLVYKPFRRSGSLRGHSRADEYY
ncbi:hypothetical protein [Granulosicoccus sp. 3-233]|uniref:hypothetical protein n=1 Tax=Granulosicoccus sp. 3-233 TaxID=3417969 RepID=UPI003D357D42